MYASNYNAPSRSRYVNPRAPPKSQSVAMMPSPSAAHAVLVSPATSLDDDEARAERRLQKVYALSQKLSQYTRGSDRRQVLRTLLDPDIFPQLHDLGGVSGMYDIATAKQETAGERASLNGVKFLQMSSGLDRQGGAPVDSYFLQTVREVCGHMCDMEGVNADPMALYGGLLLRLCHSTSKRNALEALTLWTSGRTGEFVLLPVGRRHHRPGSMCPLAETAQLEMPRSPPPPRHHCQTVSHQTCIRRPPHHRHHRFHCHGRHHLLHNRQQCRLGRQHPETSRSPSSSTSSAKSVIQLTLA